MNRQPPPPINPNFEPSAPPLQVPRSPAPNEAELRRFGKYLGVSIRKHPELRAVVLEAIKTPLPSNWKEYESENKEVYYYNQTLGLSTWEHPTDAYYRSLIAQRLGLRCKVCCIL